MHIPDGFLDQKIIVATSIISGGYLFYSIKFAQKSLSDKLIPVVSVLCAIIFAAQMVNFPVAGGTSGHFLGGGFAAILVGPYLAAIIMSIVLIIQCFFFADGGISALGANILNMAIVAPLVTYFIFILLRKFFKVELFIAGIASGISVVIAAVFCSIEIGLSKTAPFLTVLGAMTFWHILIGIGEGVITTFSLGFISRWLPEIKNDSPLLSTITTNNAK
jgi:cobalt/nickel transport system permease protein